MTFPLEDTVLNPPSPALRTETSDVSVIRREFVALTGDHFSAVVLNQLLYWTQRVKDFDLLLEEERQFRPNCNIPPRHGWIYKTADELNEETMLGISHPTMRKYLKLLIDQGWVDERANPVEKWNKTTQYRVNLRKIQEDLYRIGYTFPYVYIKAFASSLQGLPSPSDAQKSFKKMEEVPNVKNLHSDENPEVLLNNPSKNEENSNVRNLHSDVKIFDSNVRNLHSYTYTENTTKIKTKEHTHRTCARENFAELEKTLLGECDVDQILLGSYGTDISLRDTFLTDESLRNETIANAPIADKSVTGEPFIGGPLTEESVVYESIGGEMVSHWEKHVVQKLFPLRWQGIIQLTDERKDQLESLFSFHFQNDMRLWEQFCLRVKSSNFMTGGGPNGWKVSLDWILKDGNVLKVMEGNYDRAVRPGAQEDEDFSYLDNVKPNPVRDAEKAAIIASIKDPVWKNWCTKLAEGLRLNELQMLEAPLSLGELNEISNARFLECENEKLVWIGSEDPSVLGKIDNLCHKIKWVFAKEYPKSRCFRTRLLEKNLPQKQGFIQSPPLSPHPTQQQGDIHHA